MVSKRSGATINTLKVKHDASCDDCLSPIINRLHVIVSDIGIMKDVCDKCVKKLMEKGWMHKCDWHEESWNLVIDK